MDEQLKVKITADAKDLKKNIDNAEKEVKDFGKESEKAAEVVEEAFEKINDSVSVAMTATAGVVTAAAAAVVTVTESTREYRNAQAKLNTAFKDAGGSADTARKVYTKLNGVIGDSDVAVEAAAHLAKLTTDEKELAKWTQACTGIYATFGDSLPIEGLTEAANETAKTGALTGVLADALNWAGISEDTFQSQLDSCTSEQERQNLILTTLTKTYSGAAKEFERANKDIIEANKATEEWNNTMADIGASFEPVVTEVKKFGTEILKEAKEPLSDLADFIVDDLIPGITQAADWVEENKDAIIGVITGVAAALVTYKAATLATKAAEEGLTVAMIARTAAQKALDLVMAASPTGLVVTALAALTAGVIAYTLAAEDATEKVEVLTEAEKELIEESSKAADEFRDMKSANDESIAGFMATIGHTEDLVEELFKLVDANGKVQEADEARVQFILNELNEALGTEYSMVDGVIQQYDALTTSIYDVIQAKTANTLLETRNDEYIAALENEDDALQALIATQKDKDAQIEKTKQAEEEYLEFSELVRERVENARTESELRSLRDLANRKENLRIAWENEQEILTDKEKAYNEAADNYGLYYDTISEYENAAIAIQQGNYESAIDMLTAKGDYFLEYSNEVDDATKKVIDSLYKEAIDAGIEAERTKSNFEKGVDGYTQEMVDEAEQGYEDALKKWEDAYNDAHDLGDNFSSGVKNGMNNGLVPNKFASIYGETLGTWSGAKSDGTSLGEDLAEGVEVGFDNKESSLISRARSLVASIWSAMKEAAESNSPSKKTMRLGEDLGTGLEIGMDSSTPDVVASAQEMMRKTIMPIEGTLSWNNISGIFDTANMPTIHPQVSTQDIQSVELATQLAAVLSGNNTPIVLQVDGKTFAKTSISTINELTKQTGRLDLVMA